MSKPSNNIDLKNDLGRSYTNDSPSTNHVGGRIKITNHIRATHAIPPIRHIKLTKVQPHDARPYYITHHKLFDISNTLTTKKLIRFGFFQVEP